MKHAAGMAGKTEVKRGAKAPRRSAAEWAAEVAAWKRSGMTAREYARSYGISAATLQWWSSRRSGLGEQRASPRGRASSGGEPGTAMGFLPVRVSTRARAPEHAGARATELVVEIELVGGRRVRVAGGFGFEELARLLDVVEGGE